MEVALLSLLTLLTLLTRDVRGGLLFRGAGRGANQPIQKFYKRAKKNNITYYNINYNIIISAENMYSIRNRDYDHPILISIIIIIIAIHCHRD